MQRLPFIRPRTLAILLGLATLSPLVALPKSNLDPRAQWFPKAGLGLFVHYGILATIPEEPSWAMLDRKKGREVEWPPARYYGQTNVFHPDANAFRRWTATLKESGYRYAVLTTKHHDGFALWPSKFGDLNTAQTPSRGDDLVASFVDACRASDLRVGFYFSPADWWSLDFPNAGAMKEQWCFTKDGIDYATWRGRDPSPESEANLVRVHRFFTFLSNQVEELMTRYGKVDLLWWDQGPTYRWPGIDDPKSGVRAAISNWGVGVIKRVRELQPGIVLNNRFPACQNAPYADFDTSETATIGLPKYIPKGWWEHCSVWNGMNWGYMPGRKYRTLAQLLDGLSAIRAEGGNLLLNSCPMPSGDQPPEFYAVHAELAAWMATGRESLVDTTPVPGGWKAHGSLALTASADRPRWYVHVPASYKSENVEITNVVAPSRAILLRTGAVLPIEGFENGVRIGLSRDLRNTPDDVIALDFKAANGSKP